MKKLLFLILAGISLFCFSSCTVPTYVQSTPNIPMLEEQYDFEVSVIPPLINFSTPELLPRGELLASFAPLDNFFVQGSFLLGGSADSTGILNWDTHKFKQHDYSFGAGYFAMLDEHFFSVSSGYGGGKLNLAKIWEWPTDVDNLKASYARYNRFYLQGGYSIFISEGLALGIGLRYEINDYRSFRLLDAKFDQTTNSRYIIELNEWKDKNLFVFSPVFSLTKKYYDSPISAFVKFGSSNMQNWNDFHVNKRFMVVGITFSPDYN